jgi:hypothetical protein
MTIGGWTMIIASWGAIIGLAAFCFTTMIRSGKM